VISPGACQATPRTCSTAEERIGFRDHPNGEGKIQFFIESKRRISINGSRGKLGSCFLPTPPRRRRRSGEEGEGWRSSRGGGTGGSRSGKGEVEACSARRAVERGEGSAST
jgi:hypothetical protein